MNSPSQIAQQYLAVIPRALPIETIKEYGLDLTPAQIHYVTKELLTLSLFWISCGLTLIVAKDDYQETMRFLRQGIQESWETEFGLEGQSIESFWVELPQRISGLEDITREGGDLVAVLSHAAQTLAATAGIDATRSHQVLGILLDWAPVDEIGEVTETLENQ